MFLALYTWYEYSLYLLIKSGLSAAKAERLIDVKVPYWFYLLPLAWLLLMVDSYEPHIAASWKKTLRSIAVAPITGLLGYSLLFTINQDPDSLPVHSTPHYACCTPDAAAAWV